MPSMISNGWGRASPGGRITGAGDSWQQKRISLRARKALNHITIEKGSRRRDGGRSLRWNHCLGSRGAKKCTLLGLEDVMALSMETLGKRRDVANVCWGIEFLKCHGIRAVVVDDDVTVMDEESTCSGKIAWLQGGIGVVEKFVQVGGSGKGGNLEEERDALGRDGGGAVVGKSYCCRCFVIRSIHYCRLGPQQGARWKAEDMMIARMTAQEALTKGLWE
jgi:hypothetical protein